MNQSSNTGGYLFNQDAPVEQEPITEVGETAEELKPKQAPEKTTDGIQS